MAFFTGKDVIVKIGGTPTAITQFGTAELEITTDVIDTTSLGDSGKSNINGFEDNTMNFELHLDSTITEHSTLLTVGTSFAWEGYFEGETTGQLKLSGTNRVTSVAITGQVGDKVTARIGTIGNSSSGVTIAAVPA